MAFVKTSDFVGIYSLQTNASSQLQSYIDTFEKEILIKLLGAELYDLYVADLVANVSQSSEFLVIQNEGTLDVYDKKYKYLGLKSILIPFIYFQYVRSQRDKNTLSGGQTNQSSLSVQSTYTNSILAIRMNKAVEQSRILQLYLQENETETYPTFKGCWFEMNSII